MFLLYVAWAFAGVQTSSWRSPCYCADCRLRSSCLPFFLARSGPTRAPALFCREGTTAPARTLCGAGASLLAATMPTRPRWAEGAVEQMHTMHTIHTVCTAWQRCSYCSLPVPGHHSSHVAHGSLLCCHTHHHQQGLDLSRFQPLGQSCSCSQQLMQPSAGGAPLSSPPDTSMLLSSQLQVLKQMSGSLPRRGGTENERTGRRTGRKTMRSQGGR